MQKKYPKYVVSLLVINVIRVTNQHCRGQSQEDLSTLWKGFIWLPPSHAPPL